MEAYDFCLSCSGLIGDKVFSLSLILFGDLCNGCFDGDFALLEVVPVGVIDLTCVFVWISPHSQLVAELVFGKIRPSVVFSGAPETLTNHWFPTWSIFPRVFYICCRHWFYPTSVQLRRSYFLSYSSLQFSLLPGRTQSSCVSPQLFIFIFCKHHNILRKPDDLVGSLHM